LIDTVAEGLFALSNPFDGVIEDLRESTRLVSRIGNGSNFLAEDFWTTDRTFIGLGQPPVRENILHLFDYHTNAGPDTYTLVYAAPSTVLQTNPPVSAVFSLPPRSPPTFGVVWSGANYVGQASIAYYDIFASDNGGAFTLWQTHTTATGALYYGSLGHTYSFYSVATDTAGNVDYIDIVNSYFPWVIGIVLTLSANPQEAAKFQNRFSGKISTEQGIEADT